MKKTKTIFVIGIIIISIGVLNFTNQEEQTKMIVDVKPNASYWEVTPIIISGNDGWEVVNSTYEWCSGNGTFENPCSIQLMGF